METENKEQTLLSFWSSTRPGVGLIILERDKDKVQSTIERLQEREPEWVLDV